MHLSKPTAVLLLIATLLPVAYLFYFVGTMLAVVIGGPTSDPIPGGMVLLFALHIACMFWLWGLIAAYLVYLFKTDVVPKEQKALWAVVLFLGNMLAMPVFWYLYVWNPLRRRAAANN
jgi:hypothetical protein